MPEAVAAPSSAGSESTGNAAPDAQTGEQQAQATPQTPPNPLVWDAEAGDWVASTKVDGKESKRKWSDLHRDAQTAASAQQRFEEAKTIKRENASLTEKARMLEELAVNPRRAMQAWQERGYDPAQVLSVLQKDLEAERNLTPEQRKLRETEQKLAKYEADERERAERERATKEEQAEHAEHERMEKSFHRAMDALKLPPSSELRGHMATLIWAMHDEIMATGGEPMSTRAATEQAFNSLKTMAKEVFSTLTPQERLALIGNDAVSAAQQAALAGAAPIPKSAAQQRAEDMPRARDGRFSRFTTFSSSRDFTTLADRGERRVK